MTTFLPDVNVWLAGVHALHVHHAVAADWLDHVPLDQGIVFCRQTQIGFLRLLTMQAVMGQYVANQRGAWDVLADLMQGKNIGYQIEPASCWELFRARTERDEVSPKHWADAYLAAFATSAGLRLVTFDRALAASVPDSVLLSA